MKAFVQRFFSPLVWLGIVSAALVSVNPIAVYADSDDPPSRVARLGSLEGTVSIQPAGVNEWSTASSNYPVSNGDRVYTDDNGRAELQIGQTVARMWKDTDLSVTNLSDNMIQLGMAQGSLRLRTFGLDPQTQIEVDTPNGALLVTQPGDFRVDAYNGDYGTVVTVNSGELEVTGPDLSQRIGSGQSLRLYGTNPIQVSGMQMPSVDQFDGWSLDRDRRLENSQSAQYVNRDAPGYDDLDDYGDWNPQTEYGPVWYPRNVPVGWAPYRYGHWVWTGPWGWTWVADEPWGYAPFHYGRWAYVRNRWGWVPGPVAVRPIWSPALVAFIGGPSFGVSVGIGGGYGNAAWFPLGPGEPYSPWYRSSPRYVNQVNITNIRVTRVVNVQNNYNNVNYNNIRYSHRDNGFTAVNGRDFSTARPVAQNMLRVNPHQFAQAPIARPDFKPTTQSVVPRPITNSRVDPARPVLLTHGGREAQAVPGAKSQPVPLRPLPPSTVQQGGGPRPVGTGNNQPRPTTIQPPHVGQAPVRVTDNAAQGGNQSVRQNGTNQPATPVQQGSQPGRTPAPGMSPGAPNQQVGGDQQHPGNPQGNPAQPGNQPANPAQPGNQHGRPQPPTLNPNRPAEPAQPIHTTPIPAPAAPASAAPQRQEEAQPRPQAPNQPGRAPAPTLNPGAPNRPSTPDQPIHANPVPPPPASAAPHRQDEIQPRPQAPNQPPQQVQPPANRNEAPGQRPPYQQQQPPQQAQPPQNRTPVPPQQVQPPQHTAPTPPPMRQAEPPQRTSPPPQQQRQEVPPQRVVPPPPQQVQPPQQRQEMPPQHAAPAPPPMRQEAPPQRTTPPPQQQRQEVPPQRVAPPPPQHNTPAPPPQQRQQAPPPQQQHAAPPPQQQQHNAPPPQAHPQKDDQKKQQQ